MPAPKRTAAKPAKAEKPAGNGNGHAQQDPALQEALQEFANRQERANHLDSDREARATQIKHDGGYDGTLTPKLLAALTPLLREPINPKYIVHREPRKAPGSDKYDLPYASTGIRSVQVQIDRLTEVLGLGHFRLLPHHQGNDGQLCRAHAVIGNDLHWCTIAENGTLQPYTVVSVPARNMAKDGAMTASDLGEAKHAQVLAHAEGWGGHSRGTGKGDLFKGSETNAAKRTIARLGPGHEVYCQDFEDDPRQPENKAAQQGAPQGPQERHQAMAASTGGTAQLAIDQAAGIDPVDWDVTLQTLRDHDDELRPLRQEVDQGMAYFELSSRQRAERLKGADTREKLLALKEQVQTALDAAAANADQPSE